MLNIPKVYENAAYSDNHPYEVELAHVGQGNWRAFRAIGISLREVMDIASGWAGSLRGIARPWLCWHVDGDWSLVQQRLVASAGWTPVVGFDPRVGPPRQVVPEAIVVDFNKNLGFPILYPHFVLEFAFLLCKKLAFWHADLLVRPEKFMQIARIFNELEDGITFAIKPQKSLRDLILYKNNRYWELIGCTTEKASRDQFENGCGWWMDYWAHPNQRNAEYIKKNFYWDHGSGIFYWHKIRRGKCIVMSARRFAEGHCTTIGKQHFKKYMNDDPISEARREMYRELRENFDLKTICKNLSLEPYLDL